MYRKTLGSVTTLLIATFFLSEGENYCTIQCCVKSNFMVEPEKLEYTGEFLLHKKFATFARKLERHLEVVNNIGSGMPTTLEGYTKFMFTVLRPLIKHGYLIKRLKKTGEGYCDHLIVPKDNFGHNAYVMNYTMCPIEYLLPTVAAKGLQKMMDLKMGNSLKDEYPMVKDIYRVFFAFYGPKVIMEYTN